MLRLASSSQVFYVTSGGCSADSDGCFYSPNYPYDYDDDESCVIKVAQSSTLVSVSFRTEYRYDPLIIDGEIYSGVVVGGTAFTGTTGPNGVSVTAGEYIYFFTDDTVVGHAQAAP